jgi:hypothetical protein
MAWKRPFEARWRADFLAEGFEEGEVAAFLRLAAQLGLSEGSERKWRAAYPRREADEAGSPAVETESRDFRLPDKRGELPRYRPWGPEAGDLVWPCIFRGKETLLTLPARWPCYPNPTRGRLDRIQRPTPFTTTAAW